MDTVSPEQRSKNMAAVRSRGNKTTELALASVLRAAGVTGWRRQCSVEGIKPDFVFPAQRVAVFVHGCFWHGCPEHMVMPKTRTVFWRSKIAANRQRDKTQKVKLRAAEWRVLAIWEHDIKKKSRAAIRRIIEAVQTARR